MFWGAGMNPKIVEEKAMQRFGTGGLLCAETVLNTIAEEAGLQSAIIPKIATGFCSGLARTGGMCGAVSGGIMALGLIYGRDSEDQDFQPLYGHRAGTSEFRRTGPD